MGPNSAGIDLAQKAGQAGISVKIHFIHLPPEVQALIVPKDIVIIPLD